MADIVKIVDIEIDTAKAISDIIALKKEMQGLESRQKILSDQGNDLTEEYVQNSSKLKALNDELRINEKITKTVIQAEKSQVGSIEQLSQQLALTTIEWNKLSEKQREDTEEGKRITKQKTELTEKLKELRKATGDHRMEVGNYNMTMKGLKQELKELKGILQSSAEGTDEYNNALKRAAKITDDLGDMQARI